MSGTGYQVINIFKERLKTKKTLKIMKIFGVILKQNT